MKQEMPSLQQKSTRNGPVMYLTVGKNLNLIILGCYDGRSPGHKNVHVFFFKKLSLAFS